MEIFAATIFETILGTAMNLIVIPLFIIFSICFYIAKLLMPFIATTMLNGFVAIRGLLTFAVNLLTSFIIIDMV